MASLFSYALSLYQRTVHKTYYPPMCYYSMLATHVQPHVETGHHVSALTSPRHFICPPLGQQYTSWKPKRSQIRSAIRGK